MSMTISNKKLGSDFERDVAKKLFDKGWWVHNFAQGPDGQPADLIAVKDDYAMLIDCKVISSGDYFDLSRIEPNQLSVAKMYEERTWFKYVFVIGHQDHLYIALADSAFTNWRAMEFDEFLENLEKRI